MLEIVALLPWAFLVLALPWLLWRKPRIESYPLAPRPNAPLVSIIVPARDEAANIGACLATLLDSLYASREIIVVDDRSRDGTAEIATALAERSEGRLRVVTGEPLPPDWFGKSWACWQGYRAATGELLLFTDADTKHSPQLLTHAVGALQAERADLLTVLSRQRFGGFWERLIMPHILLILQLRYPNAAWINRSRKARDVVANGQFVLVRREAYEAIGGHEAVRSEVVEDLRLAQRIVASGRRLFAVHGERLMETRMYRSLAGIIEGWSKNVAIGARGTVDPWLRPAVPWLITAFLLVVWLLPPAALLASLFGGAGFVRAWAAGAIALSLLFWLFMQMSLRVPLLYTFLYPFGATAAAGIFVRSALRGERVQWKGRVYDGGETKAAILAQQSTAGEANTQPPARSPADTREPGSHRPSDGSEHTP